MIPLIRIHDDAYVGDHDHHGYASLNPHDCVDDHDFYSSYSSFSIFHYVHAHDDDAHANYDLHDSHVTPQIIILWLLHPVENLKTS